MAERTDQRGRTNCSAQITAAILALALVVGVARSMEQPADQSAGPVKNAVPTQVVTIRNMQFIPAELIVKPGSRVVWVNQDLFPHTATASAKSFDSGSIEAGASWSYVASQPGDYAYLCALHPTMKGRLIVR